MSKETAEYCTWRAMKSRCNCPTNKSYHNYGGRGIIVCACWNESFQQFLADMGPRPHRGYTIERDDYDGHYEPLNCRWATRREQDANKRTNRLVTLNGKTKTRMEWSKELNIQYSTIRWRLDNLGLPVEEALDPELDLGPKVYGESHPQAKANNQIVDEIRTRNLVGATISQMARDYGLDRKTVRLIARGDTWKHLL